MDNVQLILQIVNALNAAAPGIASLIMLIKNDDGTISVPVLLDRADEQFDENLKMIADRIKK